MQKIKADAVGLIVLALLITLASFLISSEIIAKPLWIFIYLILASCGLFLWRRVGSIKKTRQWFFISILSFPAAVIWFWVSGAISYALHGNAVSDFSVSFDMAMALMFAPGLASIAFAGWIRAFYLEYFNKI